MRSRTNDFRTIQTQIPDVCVALEDAGRLVLDERSNSGVKRGNLPLFFFIGCTALVGLFGIRLSFRVLWVIWSRDPLQSMGRFLLAISVVLFFLAWRRLGWQRLGTWWGLVPIGLSFVLSLFHNYASLYWTGGGRITVAILPVTLPIFLYVGGLALLFGGWKLFKVAWFPLLLLMMLKPVPIFFSAVLDLPLQHLTASVARSFATTIGFAPKTPALLLMFSPDFGMFIAPGCDGIRGAAAMGYLALIVGYTKRLRPLLWIMYVAGAVMLGYLFNFLRICTLVLYYRLALGHVWWESVAKQADYVIGICLFMTGVMFFAPLIMLSPESAATQVGDERVTVPGDSQGTSLRKCCGVLLILGIISSLFLYASRGEAAANVYATEQGERMPDRIGNYQLKKIWYEEVAGIRTNEDALYESSATGQQVVLIMWLVRSEHNVHDSWYARGSEAEFRSMTEFVSAGGKIVFDTGLYSDSTNNEDTFLMSTMCTPSHCSDVKTPDRRMHFVITAPDVKNLSAGHGRVVEIAAKIVTPHSSASSEARSQAMASLAQMFVSGMDPKDLSRRFQ